MASLVRHSARAWRVRYRLYYPDGTSRVGTRYHQDRAQAQRLKDEAERLEAITRQNSLTPDLAPAFVHWGLLTSDDLAYYFPRRQGLLAWDAPTLLSRYQSACEERMTSARAKLMNRLRAEHLVERLGNLSQLTPDDIHSWRRGRLRTIARKTANLELDVLRQLLDECQRLGWCEGNVARQVPKLSWSQVRLPRALTYVEVQRALEAATTLSYDAPPHSPRGGVYRLLVAGLYFGLRRGELQSLLGSDTTGRQVIVQGKTLPDGSAWVPKSRQARVIAYGGIERPIAVVFGESPRLGFVFSPAPDSQRPWHPDALGRVMDRVLKPIAPDLSLHALRHTFASWRLEMGDSLIRVRALMGHASADTLLRYAHVTPELLHDLLPLI